MLVESIVTLVLVCVSYRCPITKSINMAHLMKKKHKPAKSDIVGWLWTIPYEDAFWRELKSYAVDPDKNWKKFGNLIRKRWVSTGRNAEACNSLQGSFHCVEIWRRVGWADS